MSGTATKARRDGVAYYPGCSLHGTSREYDESLRAVAEALAIRITEIDDWSCCGASSGHTTDHLLGVALPARNLALAEAQGFDKVLAPCAACYNRLAAARHAVAKEEGLAERMPDVLGRSFENSVEVFNAVQLLRDATRPSARGRPRPGRLTHSSASSSRPTTAACSYAPPRSAATTTPKTPRRWTKSSPPAAPSRSTGT